MGEQAKTDPPVQQALAAVMGEVRAVRKDSKNTAQHFNFRGIDAVLNAVGPALRKHGVIVQPKVTELRYEPVTVQNNKRAVNVLAFVTYTFVGPAGDTLDTAVVGEGIDYGDKGVSKAMSVALRTALIQTLALPTDEPDADAEVYERATPAPRQAPAPPQPDPELGKAAQGVADLASTSGDTDSLRELWGDAGGRGLLGELVTIDQQTGTLKEYLQVRAGQLTPRETEGEAAA